MLIEVLISYLVIQKCVRKTQLKISKAVGYGKKSLAECAAHKGAASLSISFVKTMILPEKAQIFATKIGMKCPDSIILRSACINMNVSEMKTLKRLRKALSTN